MLDKIHKFLNKNQNLYIYKTIEISDQFFPRNKAYCNAPARNKISVVIVNINDTIIEKRKSIILPSNHHQNAIHKKTIIILK
jgi:hypothetical protein